MNINKIVENEFYSKIKSGKTIVVDFYADWCMPCKMLSPIVKELADENPDIEFIKINVDKCPQIAEKYGINAIPAMLFFKNEKLIESIIGFNSKQKIQELIYKVR